MEKTGGLTLAAIEKMIETLEAAKADAIKFDNGTAAAGARVRKSLQEVKNLVGEERKAIQARKSAK